MLYSLLYCVVQLHTLYNVCYPRCIVVSRVLKKTKSNGWEGAQRHLWNPTLWHLPRLQKLIIEKNWNIQVIQLRTTAIPADLQGVNVDEANAHDGGDDGNVSGHHLVVRNKRTLDPEDNPNFYIMRNHCHHHSQTWSFAHSQPSPVQRSTSCGMKIGASRHSCQSREVLAQSLSSQ